MPDFRDPITTSTARGFLLSLLLLPALLHAASITVDGTGDTIGQLPVVTYGLAEQTPSGEDILPSGPSGFFLFGLFDTGSTGVAINADGTNMFFGADDATNLGIAGTRTVDVRVNGLGATNQVDPTTVTAPIGAPGSGFEPEVQVSSVAVGPENVPITLLGAPVANQVAASIDYTTTVTRTISSGSILAPDITLMSAADAAAMTTDVEVALTPFGSVGQNADGEDRGQRYYIEDASMNSGGNSVTGFDFDFFWDSGTTATILSTEIANFLGLDLLNPDFVGTVAGNLLSGFSLDSIVLNGIGGSYTVNNAEVFVDPSVVPFGGAADAILGSNLFSQTRLLFNGPGNTLGIGDGTATPVSEPGLPALLLVGLAGLIASRRLRR